jgi:hypothetical protein
MGKNNVKKMKQNIKTNQVHFSRFSCLKKDLLRYKVVNTIIDKKSIEILTQKNDTILLGIFL